MNIMAQGHFSEASYIVLKLLRQLQSVIKQSSYQTKQSKKQKREFEKTDSLLDKIFSDTSQSRTELHDIQIRHE